jgi:hypothetical protein
MLPDRTHLPRDIAPGTSVNREEMARMRNAATLVDRRAIVPLVRRVGEKVMARPVTPASE